MTNKISPEDMNKPVFLSGWTHEQVEKIMQPSWMYVYVDRSESIFKLEEKMKGGEK